MNTYLKIVYTKPNYCKKLNSYNSGAFDNQTSSRLISYLCIRLSKVIIQPIYLFDVVVKYFLG